MRRAIVLALVALLPTLAPPATAVPIPIEEFEVNALIPTPPGTRIDCSVGNVRCSLQIKPLCCGQLAVAQKKLPTAVRVLDTTKVSVDFRATTPWSDTDVGYSVELAGGSHVRLELTEGISPNNGLTLRTSNGGLAAGFGAWWEVGAWQTASIVLDPAARTTHAEFRNSAGELVATSPALPLPAGTTLAITSVTFTGVMWKGTGPAYWFDSLMLETGPI